MLIADFEGDAYPVDDVGIARTIDEAPAAYCHTPRFGFQQDCIDSAAFASNYPGALCVEQQVDTCGFEHRIGGTLECSSVVGLGVDLSEDQVGLVESIQLAHMAQQVIGHTVHHLAYLTEHVGVQSAEVRDSACSSHAAQKSVVFRKKYFGPILAGSRGGGDACRTTSKDDNIVVADNRDFSRRLDQFVLHFIHGIPLFQSSSILCFWMTGFQRATSAATTARNSLGVFPTGSMY
jgi:hypothetical protein